jgi:hypothetical protein
MMGNHDIINMYSIGLDTIMVILFGYYARKYMDKAGKLEEKASKSISKEEVEDIIKKAFDEKFDYIYLKLKDGIK